MSGIALRFHPDGAPVTEAQLAAIADRLAHRARDGASRVVTGGLGMAHARFAMTAEEAAEAQPLSGRARPLRLLLDGRIDNREEIVRQLGLAAGEARASSDAALALLAVETWGTAGLERLVGPLAVAVHDGWRGTVELFRDRTGGRGLYYVCNDRRLLAASEAHALLAAEGVDDEPDESRIASLFALVEPAPGATFFRSVRELPPGHRLVVDRDGARLERWWRPAAVRRLRYRRDDAYAERFLELLEQAVRCRMRSRDGCALLLSGGLDSAAIAAVAGAASEQSLLAVSWGFERFDDADERVWSARVARHLGLEHRIVQGDRCWPLADPVTWAIHPDTPETNAYRRLHEATYGAARDAGCRVVLGGFFGDQQFLGCEGWWWSLLRDGRIGAAWGDAVRQVRLVGLPSFLRSTVIAPPLDRLGLRRTERPTPWLTRAARRQLPEVGSDFAWARRPVQASALLGRKAAQGIVHEIWYAHHAGVEVRSPMRDGRLLDLMVGLPAAQLHRAGRRRPIVRRALAGVVDDKVRRRQDKVSLAALFRHGMEWEDAMIARLMNSPHAAWPRFVDPDWLLRTPLAEAARWSETRLYVLWQAIGLELWLERRRCLARGARSAFGVPA